MPTRFSEEKKRHVRRLMLEGVTDAAICRLCQCSQSYLTKLRERSPPPLRQVRSGHLSLEEREEILCGLLRGESFRAIARRLGRQPSTISREVKPWGRDGYRVHKAEARADALCRRPKPRKLELNPELAAVVSQRLRERWSPEQISNWLKAEYAERSSMHVSAEAIYQSLYVQGRGGLRKELAKHLRTARSKRKPHSKTKAQPRITNMVNISERPAEANDRAVPGHWEGDLIMGARGRSAVGTLVERATRFVMLLHLPNGHSAEQVREALSRKIQKLPDALRRSLTWDQGGEMAQHVRFTVDTGVQVYFCDPYKPWQRGSNENTNGLLRQYLPDGDDLSRFSEAELDEIARQLNTRPRKTLNWKTPAKQLSVALTA